MSLTIRRAVPKDFDILCELFEEGDAHHRDALPHIFQSPDGVARDREYLLAVMADSAAALIVAEEGGQLLGLMQAYARETPSIPLMVPPRYIMVDNIVVRKAARGKGIGTLLMRWVEAWAREQDAATIELNVFDFNRSAIEFYNELGYEMQSHRMSKPVDKK